MVRGPAGPRVAPEARADAQRLLEGLGLDRDFWRLPPDARGTLVGMWRHRSRRSAGRDEPATDEEVQAAALQFVRKVSGYRVPSKANTEAFDAAVDDVAEASKRLLDTLAARTARS